MANSGFEPQRAREMRFEMERSSNLVEQAEWLLRKSGEAKSANERSEPSFGSASTRPPLWPKPLAAEAYHGVIGDIVKVLEPASEADPTAILIQILVMFGNIIGHGSHYVVEEDHHALNLYAVMVGKTSKGRKGVSFGRARRIFEAADTTWASNRIAGGLSSGEGLLYAVRDPVSKREAIRERRRVVEYQQVEIDPGEIDKRLLVHEPEFALALRVMGRDGNTLSALIHQAWDSGNLRSLTKNNPLKASNAHISIVGHVTNDKLLRYPDSTEVANSFANHFLWVGVSRSKCLPDDEDRKVDESKLGPLVRKLTEAVTITSNVGQMRRDADAANDWRKVYPALSEGKPGLFGAIISRAEAQVMRLACLYALSDGSAVVRREHLRAALAVWEYCEESAHYIFGGALGDPIADAISEALKRNPSGMTRTDISSLFGRHKNSGQISRALIAPQETGRAKCDTESTEGRTAERWFAI